jgi:hypothetical protein
VYEEHPGAPKPPGEPEASSTTLNAWQGRLQTLEAIASYYALEYTVTFPDGPVRLHGGQVAPSLFPLLRAMPQAGRFFRDGEDAPRANLFVVISDRLWRERLGSAPDAVGRTLKIEGKPHLIVGIAKPDFHFPDQESQLWTPYDDPARLDPTIQGGVWLSLALGRLKRAPRRRRRPPKARPRRAVCRGHPRSRSSLASAGPWKSASSVSSTR